MKEKEELSNKAVFLDLDGTIINTISGETFPKGIWDMKFNFELLDALKKIKPSKIGIVTNQGGIGIFVPEMHFRDKLQYIEQSIAEYIDCKCYGIYCASNVKENYDRKPNPGMLEELSMNFDFLKEDCIMIGDASGLEGQFSDSDKKTAENFGIPYYDVNEFINKFK